MFCIVRGRQIGIRKTKVAILRKRWERASGNRRQLSRFLPYHQSTVSPAQGAYDKSHQILRVRNARARRGLRSFSLRTVTMPTYLANYALLAKTLFILFNHRRHSDVVRVFTELPTPNNHSQWNSPSLVTVSTTRLSTRPLRMVSNLRIRSRQRRGRSCFLTKQW